MTEQYALVSFLKSAVINTTILLPVIIACVTYLGKLGVQGKWQLGASLALGFGFGVSAMIATNGLPADFASYFALALYGLVPGLVASGVYDTGAKLADKAATIYQIPPE